MIARVSRRIARYIFEYGMVGEELDAKELELENRIESGSLRFGRRA